MQVEEVKLHHINKLVRAYKKGEETVKDKFDYLPFSQESYIERAEEVKMKEYKREELADILVEMNGNWNAPEPVLQNIERLREPESMVAIGGQQAGLLTGPLYTIHKIISLLHMAKKQEKELGLPVIPVFWIAGEDHDFDEINHVFMAGKDKMKKHTISQYHYDKQPVSDISIDRKAARHWLEDLFKELEETENTKQIMDELQEALDNSVTYVDFFAELVMRMFGETGLVLVDSGNNSLRRLESDFFKKMILRQSAISRGVHKEIQRNRHQGYPAILEMDERDAHLFYHQNKERILLIKGEDGRWKGKHEEVLFTEEEMLELADKHPEKLSNNVVTRPLMQELLFPTLVFVGGPGEVAYWSVLKPAFAAMDCKMPVVLPRMSITLVDRKSYKQLNALSLSPADAVNFGLGKEKGNWLASRHSPPINTMAEEIKKSIERSHSPLREVAKEMGSDLGDVAEKNLYYLYRDIDFLQDKLIGNLEEKNKKQLNVFDKLDLLLQPHSGLQERVWNILPWLNEYGMEFLHQLPQEKFEIEADHYLIYL